ncbi:MAG: hypothetical protein ACK8QZ_11530, partial [Anaerolineales bacterium]
MDIRSGIWTIVVLSILGALGLIYGGLQAIRASRRLTFFRLRRRWAQLGWRMIIAAFFLFVFAIASAVWGEPLAYRYFPPSPTPTNTPLPIVLPSLTPTPESSVTAVASTETQTLTPSPAF